MERTTASAGEVVVAHPSPAPGTVDGMSGDLGEEGPCVAGTHMSWVVYLEHPATRSSMPGDVRCCPADDQRRSGLGSFSARKTSLGETPPPPLEPRVAVCVPSRSTVKRSVRSRESCARPHTTDTALRRSKYWRESIGERVTFNKEDSTNIKDSKEKNAQGFREIASSLK